MARHPLVTIGSHGLWHRNFTGLTHDEARFELIESRRLLEDVIETKVDLLAWPYGECNPEVERLSGECGYRASWSVWKGTNAAHSLWRVPLGGRDNMARFIAKSSGLYALTEAKLHRAKAKLRRAPIETENSAAPAGLNTVS
jgi:peptidoglycan/xylan/chitin deacetylase (PgdA/CDA1 family)